MDGSLKLRAFLDRHGITLLSAAAQLGVSDPTIHDWCKGTKRPRAHHRESIAVWTRGEVTAESWLREDERAAMANVLPYDATAESGEHLAVDLPDTGTD